MKRVHYVEKYLTDPQHPVTVNLIGRQLFTPADIGINKAQCLVSRVNAAFGLDWEAVGGKFPVKVKNATEKNLANIFITCTDNIASRHKLDGFLNGVSAARKNNRSIDHKTLLYWMDFGNRQMAGTVRCRCGENVPEKGDVTTSGGNDLRKHDAAALNVK